MAKYGFILLKAGTHVATIVLFKQYCILFMFPAPPYCLEKSAALAMPARVMWKKLVDFINSRYNFAQSCEQPIKANPECPDQALLYT